MEIKEVLNKVIDEFNNEAPNIDSTGDEEGQKNYLEIMKKSYFITLKNCLKVLPYKNSNICELGAFLGIVSKSLKYLGHNVIACDIPYFFDKDEIKKYFSKSSIKSLSFNLRNYQIPISDESQDLVIACEILEHLNFNPLPIVKEINRILKLGGLLYIATPNADSFVKKIRYLITGRQPSFKTNQFFEQLDASKNMVVGLHWREYNSSEINAMILPFGFELIHKKLTSDIGTSHGGLLISLIKKIIFALPGCKPNQILIFKKLSNSNIKLDINKDS